MKNIKYMTILLTLIITTTMLFPNGTENRTQEEKLQLPEKFRTVLVKEMIEIENGMRNLVSLMARGELEKASVLADKIHDSFILKSSLTKEELKELVGLLPQEFIRTDRAFHGNAKKLSEALKLKQLSESAKIYGEMLNGCLTCHSEYAADKFQGLVKLNKIKGQ